MSNGPYGRSGRRIKDARGFKIKVFDVLHNQTYWYSKTYSSLRNIKLAIAQGGFNERQFLVSDGWNADTLGINYRMCVELYIYDVETWKLAAVRKGDNGTNIVELTDRCQNCTLDDYSRSYWVKRAGEWEDKVKTQEEMSEIESTTKLWKVVVEISYARADGNGESSRDIKTSYFDDFESAEHFAEYGGLSQHDFFARVASRHIYEYNISSVRELERKKHEVVVEVKECKWTWE